MWMMQVERVDLFADPREDLAADPRESCHTPERDHRGTSV